MSFQGLLALTTTWAVIDTPEDFNYLVPLEVWMKEVICG
jgi:hypothetical protein